MEKFLAICNVNFWKRENTKTRRIKRPFYTYLYFTDLDMDSIAKLRQELALTMQEYCRHTRYYPDHVLHKLYEKYNVSSRSELTEEQLHECIKSYRAWIAYEEVNPIESEYQRLLQMYNHKGKKESWSTGMQAVVRYMLDHPSKIWYWSYELIGKTNSKNEFISHRWPARASDLAIHHPDIVEDRKIGRFAVYRLKTENMKEIEKFLSSSQK